MEGVSGTLETTIHNILTKYLMKKKAAAWWVLQMLFPIYKQRYMELCPKHLTSVFATNNHYKWNMGAWHRTRTEISERGLEGKNSLSVQKFQHQASRVKQMMMMAYNYTSIIASYVMLYGCTVDQHVYVHFLQPKVWQMCPPMFDRVIILYENSHPHIAMLGTTAIHE